MVRIPEDFLTPRRAIISAGNPKNIGMFRLNFSRNPLPKTVILCNRIAAPNLNQKTPNFRPAASRFERRALEQLRGL